MAILLKRPLAELDLLNIWDYIADDSPDRADDFLDRIESKLMSLAQNSGLGRKRSELLPDLRSFPIDNYVVFYQQIDGGIDVIRLLHGSRDIEEVFKEN
ncbi:MAG: type II toxin-antitoxin system RelE/ParE family toxin [Snowella sp.]|jgi:toxin ParE1/3/4|nr:MAG: type II toxin-antitoxin system RelE/ParE family toxin [Snowella sp.]